MQIYGVKNPQGFFCQSKADVECKQHLVHKPYMVCQGFYFSGAPAARRTAKRRPIPTPYMESKGNLWTDFFMVIMANGIAGGRVGTTASKKIFWDHFLGELRNQA